MQWHCRNRHLLYGTDTENAHIYSFIDSVYTITSARTHKCLGRYVQNWYAVWAESVLKASATKKQSQQQQKLCRCRCICFSLAQNIVSSKRHSEWMSRIRTKSSTPRMVCMVECECVSDSYDLAVAVCATANPIKYFDDSRCVCVWAMWSMYVCMYVLCRCVFLFHKWVLLAFVDIIQWCCRCMLPRSLLLYRRFVRWCRAAAVVSFRLCGTESNVHIEWKNQ